MQEHGVALPSIPWRRVAGGLLAAGVGLLARLGSMLRLHLMPANHDARSLAAVNNGLEKFPESEEGPCGNVKTAGPGGRRWDG
jgi:hypothetical protein